MKTTLNKIRKHKPCKDSWGKILKHLSKTKADDEELSLLTILDSNGLDDTLWCLRAVEGYDKEIRLYAVWCARQVHHLMKDPRSIKALDVAERFANGQATKNELDNARDAAWDAAYAAYAAAWDDVKDSDSDAARAAASGAAWDASAAASVAIYVAWAASAAAGDVRDAASAAVRSAKEKELRRLLGECK